MQNPYSILDLEQDADEAAIRTRYLKLVRKFPPEREPEKAAEIRAAYDSLRDPVERLRQQLFDITETTTFDRLLDEHIAASSDRRISTRVLLSLGQS